MADKTKKEKPKEDLSDEQLDEVAGGVVRKPVMLSPEALSTDEKLTTETSKLRRRQ
jgi:hypothetical protein